MVRALPSQIHDQETGEDFDVISDDDMPAYPSEDRGDEARHDRAERGVEDGGRRGTGVRRTHYLGHRNIQHTVRYTELAPDRFKGFWKD